MPTLQNVFKSDLSRGVALGVSAALVAVAALPIIITASRPLVRAALKSSLLVYEKGREVMAEAEEQIEDLVAEVKAEIVAEREVDAEIDPAGAGLDVSETV